MIIQLNCFITLCFYKQCHRQHPSLHLQAQHFKHYKHICFIRSYYGKWGHPYLLATNRRHDHQHYQDSPLLVAKPLLYFESFFFIFTSRAFFSASIASTTSNYIVFSLLSKPPSSTAHPPSTLQVLSTCARRSSCTRLISSVTG